MVVVPLDSSAHSSVVSVVDGFSSIANYMRLLAKLVEEHVEALSLVFGQSNQAVVERQGTVLDLLKHSLENNNIMECGLDFKKIHSIQESVCVWDEVKAIWVVNSSSWCI
jgi:hypothetical protein